MINRVLLIGNVGLDPEIRSLESGVKVARLRIATNEHFSTVSGVRKEHTEWHTVVLWRSMADFAERNIHKGSQVFVEGKIRSRERIDSMGIKKTYYEVHADEIRLLGRREHHHHPEQSEFSSGNDISDETVTFGGDGMPF
ncbi:MAG: single-stranded DNA-binding protein [Rikenellaceae bacterium]